MQYDAATDPLCYPDSDVLINKAGIKDPQALEQHELSAFLTRADEPLPDGNFDFAHYCAIHHHLFQDVYDWAGKIRSIRIGKGGNWFCYPEYIKTQAVALFSELSKKHYLIGLSPEEFAAQAAHFISELNVIHAFREGNGRTQFAFLMLLSANADHFLDAERIQPDEMLSAMITSFHGDEAPLASVIVNAIA